MQAQAEEYREAMIDAISMFDDELAEKFLGNKDYIPTKDALKVPSKK